MKTLLLAILFSIVLHAQQEIRIGNFEYRKTSVSVTDSMLRDTFTVDNLTNLSNNKEVLSCTRDTRYYDGKMTFDYKRKTAACRYYHNDNAPSKSIQDSTQVYYKQQKNGLFLLSHGYYFKNGRRKVSHLTYKDEENKRRMDLYLSK